MGKPYDDADVLRGLYIEKDLTYSEIADELGCSSATVGRKLREHGIPREKRTRSGADSIGESELRELYHGEGLSIRDIADRYDVSTPTAADWLDRFDIETRTATTDLSRVPFYTRPDGYEVWRTWVDGTNHSVRVHRLVAAAEYGAEAIEGSDIHHKNGVPWDNRPENLQVVGKGEHTNIHRPEWEGKMKRSVSDASTGEGNPKSKLTESDVRNIRDRYDGGESTDSLAAEYGVSKEQIRRINRREAWTHVL